MPDIVHGQEEELAEAAEAAGLQQADLRLVIANIIRTVLGFLGIIAVIIVLWGGFRWMTAGGNPDKVATAKKILLNGVIGLVIIWTSFAITSFVLSSLIAATRPVEDAFVGPNTRGGIMGRGSAATFSVAGYSPEGEVPIRNVKVNITFSRNLDEETVEGNVIITSDETGAEVDGTLSSRGNKITFVPSAACPEPNEDRFCFDENTTFTVTVSSDIRSSTGVFLSCTAGKGCTSSFTTGDLVDVDDPFVELTFPDDSDKLEPGTITLVQVHATDDSQVSVADFFVDDVLLDAVTATGEDLSDVTIETTWDTTGYEEDQTYTISATVSDIAGNEDTDSIRVKILPAHCFNGIQDEDETDVDCGGSCGACSGEACTEDADCSGGLSCIDSICTAVPEISDVSPTNGAPGTFVTISGENFGTRDGTVIFGFAPDTVEATIPACSDGWTDDQIVVEVPEDASSGPITLTTADDLSDATDDDNGPLIEDFEVDDTVRPNLCKLLPDDGKVGSSVRLTGNNFGDSQDDSTVTFGENEVRVYNSWGDTEINVNVLTAAAGKYDVVATVAEVESNALMFEIVEVEVEGPTVVFLDPDNGGIGQYVTIAGSNFGSRVGTVWFENTTLGYTARGSIDFPEECAEDFWSDDQITIVVPDEYTNGVEVETTTHDLYVETQAGDDSNVVNFIVTTADPTPGICNIEPDEGEAGDEVTLFGASFGSTQGSGSVDFYNEVSSTVTSWSSDEIVLSVPDAVSTGPVNVTSDAGEESNSVNFAIAEAIEEEEVVVGPAEYAWRFSTGEIPETPAIVFECSDTRLSGVPNERYTVDVCVNAQINVDFTVLMESSSLIDGESVIIEECLDAECSSTQMVAGDLTSSDSEAYSTVQWTPDASYNEGTGTFKTDTTYRITFTTDVESQEGVALAKDISWEFTTGGSDVDCEVEQVIVSPDKETLTAQNATTEFNALPSTRDCQVLGADDYTWSWEIDASIASISEGECEDIDSDSCAVTEALAEGVTDVTATEDDSGISGSGTLTIDYTDPYVTNHWPDCATACVNASVGASFNIGMDKSTIEEEGMVVLYQCTNELCLILANEDNAASCELDENGECTEIKLTFSAGRADRSSFYRVIISGEVTSESGVELTRPNYGDDYSWVFGTKDDDSLCAVSRIDLEPDSSTLRVIGESQIYTVDAFGEPDECSSAGQRLDGFEYNWSWEDPIVDDPDSAEWSKPDGDLADGDPNNPKEGCTSSCLPVGSTSYDALCGNGSIETGEDCDDGNASPDDGCSSLCLAEGGGETCGDGNLDRDATTLAGEECDDGNTIDGDGCSAECLNEGSRSVGATCGNGDVAYSETVGGEDCDDGNKSSGDGCSAVCLNEGSFAVTDIVAECGDGTITTPYETCDDGNTKDGDGCSSSCRREGGNIGATCGDGDIDQDEDTLAGEDCDGGDGCSRDCTYLGSSLEWATPSVCGDGITGLGELSACESGLSGDGRDDPAQVAKISDSAPEQVDLDTNLATATIRVDLTEFDLDDEAELNLLCSAENDGDCPDPSMQGVASNRCCMLRPENPDLFPNSTSACRNAAIYAIFDQKMDATTFEDNIYVKLDTADCPDEYLVVATASSNQSWFARVWQSIKSFFVRIVRAQDEGDCLLPISSFSQSSQEDGTFKVNMRYDVLLEDSAMYTIVVKGDGNTSDDQKEGVLSDFKVGINGDTSQPFTTSSEICTLDAVEVTDTDEDSPGLFTLINETHTFEATPVSFTGGGKQFIKTIPGVYDWDWNDWREDSGEDILTIVDDRDTEADFQAADQNGEATVVASATITTDTESGTEGNTVSGTKDVIVLLCENPWPEVDDFPFIDDASGTVDGLVEAPDWMNFSTYYCRDAGGEGTDDDLPSVSVVAPPETGAEGVIKEYIFKIDDGSGDAIGIRISENPEYFAPMDWYFAQGFAGSPSEISVDDFNAIRDGRTSYVSAPNQSDSLYSNIYVFSYNEGASADAQNIFDQILGNMTFVTNLNATNLCHNGTDYTEQTCQSDLDCGAPEICGSDKDKLRRDNIRLNDMRTIEAAISVYGFANGLCSDTTSQVCTTDFDCPEGEECKAAVPTLAAGTFVRAMSSSIWESWTTSVAQVLGTLPTDPLNEYVDCGEGYDPETCVKTVGQYICPFGSHAYHYRSVGPFGYQLAADLEYFDDEWVNDIDLDPDDDFEFLVAGSTTSAEGFTGTFWCDGVTIYGDSEICGDGIVGPTETCEIGQEGEAEACDSDGDGIDDGFRAGICNATCDGFEASETAECLPPTCGNGVIEGTEECDDGSFNGKYGFCDDNCSYDDAFYCGDGSVAGGERCDCALVDGTVSGRTFGGGSCSIVNGVYNANPNNTCAWDCVGPASYCGDDIVDSGEQCDGDSDTWSGALCRSGPDRGEPCEDNDDCEGIFFGRCGGVATRFKWADECPETTVCLRGDVDEIGTACSTDADCGTGGACSTFLVQTTRTRTCADDGASGDICEWNKSTWQFIDCKAETNCGNGEIEAGEECDDGNDDTNDACTNVCTANVCGDGYLYSGTEECDNGADNDVICSASYGSTCNYCTTACKIVTTSGSFCGNGEIDGGEFCDAGDLPYYYYSSSAKAKQGTCDAGVEGVSSYTGDDGFIYTCTDIGVCNGGEDNGEICTKNKDCDNNCVFPSCAISCSKSCPFSYTSDSLLMRSNVLAARRSSSIQLQSFDTEVAEGEVLTIGNAGTLYFPECTVGTELTASVSFDNVDRPEVALVLVIDLSGSMKFEFDGTKPDEKGYDVESSRLTVTKEVLESAISQLFEELTDKMNIALVIFQSKDAEIASPSECADGWCSESQESDMIDEISDWEAKGATPTDEGLDLAYETVKDAEDIFGENIRKVIVLLSDGAPSKNDEEDHDPSDEAKTIKDDGIELYTVALTTGTSLISDMADWSSGNPDGETGIDYAYDGDTAEELEGMYQSIIESILGATVKIITTATTFSSGTVLEGVGVSFPFPEDFACDEDAEQGLPIQITFSGEGYIEVSNVQFKHCQP